MLKTNNDPLTRTRNFLKDIWDYADLDGMLIPMYQADHKSVKQAVIHHPGSLRDADPFVPLMQANAGRMVADLARKHPNDNMAAILRPCEIRALYEQVKHTGVDLENWLLIGVDCAACFPLQDFNWRVEIAGNVEALTNEVLRNVRQGSIALDRFRPACGMCARPGTPQEEICIQLLGLPAKDTILIGINNDVIIEKLNLENVCDGLAPHELIQQREKMLKTIEERREHIRERQMNELTPDLPANIEQFITFLENCQPCTSCMEACPDGENIFSAIQNNTMNHEVVMDWISSCAECGMCEQACPKEMPLVAIADRIRRDLHVESLPI
ncbi:MAG: 4Fe-4S dicluster domain-containing protein [Chloroflexi bacterium]|nr:4Fe-4S dicluster domain-containing protein [Chloroflexota bacterium]